MNNAFQGTTMKLNLCAVGLGRSLVRPSGLALGNVIHLPTHGPVHTLDEQPLMGFGKLPRSSEKWGLHENGGTFTAASLTAHLTKLRADIERTIPLTFGGILLIDEDGTMDFTNEAALARAWWEATVSTIRQLRPRARPYLSDRAEFADIFNGVAPSLNAFSRSDAGTWHFRDMTNRCAWVLGASRTGTVVPVFSDRYHNIAGLPSLTAGDTRATVNFAQWIGGTEAILWVNASTAPADLARIDAFAAACLSLVTTRSIPAA